MTTWFRTILLGLLAVVLLAPAPASAETLRFSQGALGASATFRSIDDTGCVLTDTFIAAQDERRKDGAGPGTEGSSAILSISRYDQCTGETLLAAQGSATLAPEAFTIDGLDSASLVAPIEVVDELSGTPLTVDVSLAWSGYGEPLRVRDTTQIWTSAFTVNFRFDGTDRFASASGTVTDGATDFAPLPADEAFLKDISAGRIEITRNS